MISSSIEILRRQAARIIALALMTTAYALARPPELSPGERQALAATFRFDGAALPTLPDTPARSQRAVHPSLGSIASWISAVGAAVALNDLDGDGLPNDVCYVETRSDRVIVGPVPGTGERFAPFSLDPEPLPFDRATMAPMGALMADLNEDGLTDVLVYYWGRPPLAFVRRRGSNPDASSLSTACFARREVARGGARWYTNAMAAADLDGDGHLDLIVGNYYPDDARILDASASGVEPMQDSMSRAFNGGRDRLLLWAGATAGPEPTVEFREDRSALQEPWALGWTLAVGAADLDGDLLPELYFANDFGPDRLLHNRSTPGRLRFAALEGRRGFTTPRSKVLGRDSFKGMGIDFADLNGDGWPDLYVSNIAGDYSLEESHFLFLSTGEIELMRRGVAPYVDRSEAMGLSRSGWCWDVRLADLDNDGDLEALQAIGFLRGEIDRWPELHELAMGNDGMLRDPRNWPRFARGDDLSGQQRNPFFVRAGDGRFYDLAPELGLAEPGVSRGIATADVDGDGRLDFAVANQWSPSSFYHNQAPRPGAFLGLHLRLPLSPGAAQSIAWPGHPDPRTAGRPAVGACTTIRLPDGRSFSAQVDGGNGHSGKRSPDLHFGLGVLPAGTTVRVDLRWRDPSGRIRAQTLSLAPGWHTVQLAWPAMEEGR
jgi:hypothetical protein